MSRCGLGGSDIGLDGQRLEEVQAETQRDSGAIGKRSASGGPHRPLRQQTIFQGGGFEASLNQAAVIDESDRF